MSAEAPAPIPEPIPQAEVDLGYLTRQLTDQGGDQTHILDDHGFVAGDNGRIQSKFSLKSGFRVDDFSSGDYYAESNVGYGNEAVRTRITQNDGENRSVIDATLPIGDNRAIYTTRTVDGKADQDGVRIRRRTAGGGTYEATVKEGPNAERMTEILSARAGRLITRATVELADYQDGKFDQHTKDIEEEMEELRNPDNFVSRNGLQMYRNTDIYNMLNVDTTPEDGGASIAENALKGLVHDSLINYDINHGYLIGKYDGVSDFIEHASPQAIGKLQEALKRQTEERARKEIMDTMVKGGRSTMSKAEVQKRLEQSGEVPDENGMTPTDRAVMQALADVCDSVKLASV